MEGSPTPSWSLGCIPASDAWDTPMQHLSHPPLLKVMGRARGRHLMMGMELSSVSLTTENPS